MWSIGRQRWFRRVLVAGGILLPGLVASLSAQYAPPVVRKLSFSGNKSILSEVLAAVISTTKSDWTTDFPVIKLLNIGEERTFSPDQFRRDVYTLENFYRGSGFPDVRIDTTVTRKNDEVAILFRITEGEPTRIGSIAIEGADQIADRFRVVRDLPIVVGDIDDRWMELATRDTLTARMRARGFPLAHAEVERVADSSGSRRVALRYRLITGRAAVFGPISVTGFRAVDSAFIASLLTLRPGQPYREEELYRSQRALAASELFSYATVRVDTIAFAQSDSTVVPLEVEVQEGKMYASRAAIGWGSSDCYRSSAGWTGRNFLGGRVLDVSGQLSKIGVGEPLDFGACRGILRKDSIGSSKANYSLDGSIRENGFLSPDNTLTLSVFQQRRSEFAVYLREETGGAISIRRETYARIPVTLGYRYSVGRTTADPATFCGYFNSCTTADIARLSERRVSAMLRLSATRLRVDNQLDPRRGSSLTGEIGVASRVIGSSREQQFLRALADATGYVPLSRSVVLAAHLRGGLVYAPRLDLAGGRQNFVPPEQRFYAGGPNDVRGYNRNELGPVVYVIPRTGITEAGIDSSQVRTAPIGGERVFGFSTELRTPSPVLPKLLRLAFFVDMGALGAKGTSTTVRVTPGAGIRIVIPRFAPIRLDLAYNSNDRLETGPLYTTSTESGGDLVLVAERFAKLRSKSGLTFHLAFGQAF